MREVGCTGWNNLFYVVRPEGNGVERWTVQLGSRDTSTKHNSLFSLTRHGGLRPFITGGAPRQRLSPGKGLACAQIEFRGTRCVWGWGPPINCSPLHFSASSTRKFNFCIDQFQGKASGEPPHFNVSSSNYVELLLETKICSPKFSTQAFKELKNKNHFPAFLASSLIPGHDPTLITIQMPVSQTVAMYSGI